MSSSNVTLACDDESILKHTKVFNNKSIFQCYHHNRGYCRYKDQCRYRHFQGICIKNICRDKECDKRHPVICRYKDDCKFKKANNCAFRHIDRKTPMVNTDFEKEIKVCTQEIESLKREIIDLKHDIIIKENELSESKIVIHESNENLKKRIDILEEENKALKLKLKVKNQINNENFESQTVDKENIQIRLKQSCEKCSLYFSSKEKLNKHKDEMHRVKLTF